MSNMVVNTNVLALNSHRALKGVGGMNAKASARLSSGLKINSAADDAAGLAISEKMRAQIRGLDMASKNSQDAISLIQTAEGGMQEIDNMIQRIRELTVQASNDTNEHNSSKTGDRQKMQDEISQLVEEIDSMAERVEFNKKKVINGSYERMPKDGTITDALKVANSDFDLKTGLEKTSKKALDTAEKGVGLSLQAFTSLLSDPDVTTKLASLATNFGTAAGNVSTAILAAKSGFATVIDKSTWDTFAASTAYTDLATLVGNLDTAVLATGTATEKGDSAFIKSLFTATLGTSKTAVDTAYATAATAATNYTGAVTNLAVSKGALIGAQAAYDSAEKTDGLYFQVGSNATQGMEISISSVKSDKLGIGQGNGVTTLNVLENTGTNITDQLDTLDKALSYVTTERSKLGAAQNRLEYTMKSLDISSENLSAAESRIRDTDMAKEMMNKTKSDVLQQAATAMLAKGNQAPQAVLQLLQ